MGIDLAAHNANLYRPLVGGSFFLTSFTVVQYVDGKIRRMQTFHRRFSLPHPALQHPMVRWLLIPLLLLALLPLLTVNKAQGQGSLPALLYSSYVGGDGADYVKDIAIDAEGNILVIGQTFSDTLLGYEIVPKGNSDIFVAKFDPSGTELIYLVLLGGIASETPKAIEVDAEGNIYGTVFLVDDTFPIHNALWPTYDEVNTDSALFKLDPNGDLVYTPICLTVLATPSITWS